MYAKKLQSFLNWKHFQITEKSQTTAPMSYPSAKTVTHNSSPIGCIYYNEDDDVPKAAMYNAPKQVEILHLWNNCTLLFSSMLPNMYV